MNQPMHALIEQTEKRYPHYIAYDFMGKRVSYRTFVSRIHRTAAALTAMGIKAGDTVALCLPNCPHAVEAFYAISRLGAIACMIHPLSAPDEMLYYVNHSNSKLLITLDLFSQKANEAISRANHPCTLMITTISEQLPPLKGLVYPLTQKEKAIIPPAALWWRKQIKQTASLPQQEINGDHPAVLLYSGGTTGKPKGILLSHNNMNSLAQQTIIAGGWDSIAGDKMLSVMPMFHGFGLGVGIHTALVGGGCCLLVPRFTVDSYAKLVKTKKPNFIPGVPTLFAALLQAKTLQNADLSFLKGVFSGGDRLSPVLKKQVDAFLQQHHSPVPIREGYGTTECVTASCLTPIGKEKEGSIGVAYPDITYAIVEPGTTRVLPADTEGEICLCGPTVMLGYLNDQESTNQVLQTHSDGQLWLHTGDLGCMDADGYVYFKGRLKRMIITNGYNVYPAQLEEAIATHPSVKDCCIIGVEDPIRGQRVRAYVVGNPQLTLTEWQAFLSQAVARYALPKEVVYKDSLPKTAVGKIAYRQLEEEANGQK